jgi:lipid-binding SYLF domain-containing protein
MSFVYPHLATLAVTFTMVVPSTAVQRAVLSRTRDESDAAAVIAKFKERDPGLVRMFNESAGYVVFPTVAKGGFGIGGARGKGYVYQHGHLIGKSTLTQLTVGLQAGGQAYSEVIFLEDKAALENFKRGRLKLDGQASAVALTERVAADVGYRNGVAIVTMAEGGLMYEASVGGQKLSFHPCGELVCGHGPEYEINHSGALASRDPVPARPGLDPRQSSRQR